MSFIVGAGSCLTDGLRCYNLTKGASAGLVQSAVCQQHVCLCASQELSDRMGFS